MSTALLAALFFLVALVYGSVGHAGASGYLAVMALAGVPSAQMKPTALALNLVVASIATWNFRRAGVFYPRQVAVLALGSVPMAFVGGLMPASSGWYRPILGLVLVFASARMLWPRRAGSVDPAAAPPQLPWARSMSLGAAIGLLSGLTGTGGGIFLSPLAVMSGWATVRQAAGLSASFILVNSLAGLAGVAASTPLPSLDLGVLALAAGSGGFVGSWLGANRLPERPLSVLLGVVLALAAVKMLAT